VATFIADRIGQRLAVYGGSDKEAYIYSVLHVGVSLSLSIKSMDEYLIPEGSDTCGDPRPFATFCKISRGFEQAIDACYCAT